MAAKWLIPALTYLCLVRGQSPCTTPDGKSGDCKSIIMCDSLRGMANKPGVTREEIDFLKRSACGFDDAIPKVCCPTTSRFTLENKAGECIDILKCDHIKNQLSSPGVTQEYKIYVNSLRCQGPAAFSVYCGPPPVTSPAPPPNPPPTPAPGNGDECVATAALPDPTTDWGNATAIDQYPWLALIEYKKDSKIKLLCGGVLISGRYVLTAGHCVIGSVLNSGDPSNVRLGEYDTANSGPDCVEVEGGEPGTLDCTVDPVIIPIERVIPHPDYNPRNSLKWNDIAMLRLKHIAPYTGNFPETGKLFAAGWGAVNEKISSSNLWERQVCAGGEVGKDSCKGDSGGPLMYSDGNRFEVIGIVSFGPVPCGLENVPGVYTKSLTPCITIYLDTGLPCITPDGKPGDCKTLETCIPLHKLVKNGVLLQVETLNLLRDSYCGFEEVTNKPKVCCPCVTLANKTEAGQCVNVFDCDHIRTRLATPPVPQQYKDYVNSLRCEGTAFFSVCCGPPPDFESVPTPIPRGAPLPAGPRIDVPTSTPPESISSAPSPTTPINMALPVTTTPSENGDTASCAMSAQPPDPASGCCGCGGPSPKIFGGTDAGIDQYPWLALIEYEKEHQIKLMCGGALISGRYVLTAAHCVEGPAMNKTIPKNVRLGEYDTANEKDCVEPDGGDEGEKDCTLDPVIIPIEHIIAHPEYNPYSLNKRNDIALLRLASIPEYTEYKLLRTSHIIYCFVNLENQCRTLQGGAGTCTLLDKCQPLKDIEKKPRKTDADLLFLRQSSCGLSHNFKPKPTPVQFPNPKPPVTSTRGDDVSDAEREYAESANCPSTLQAPAPETGCCGVETLGGGDVANVEQYPWLALLEYTGRFTPCGGTLISSRYVLTAAHCVGATRYGEPKRVRLGEYNTTSYPTDMVEVNGGGFEILEVVVIGIERHLQHPEYRDFIRPICLPSRDVTVKPPEFLRFFAAGWGSNGTLFSDVKQHVDLPYVPLNICQIPIKNRLNENQICAGGEAGKDSCKGDSGGPLMIENGETFELVGVVSYGHLRCGTKDFPGVYTHVYKYLDWIKREMI
ncbi:hypothetical protein MSG28_012622 [Choristoneura fumiferana]|uniref:Uncharacterized protein n=1 Tax=Choristoneura fumiferana TaxID=7141 RepID=A0ACC0JHD2_CHOFU|nr:hypothetical protein MSG28_012622 [Choristoneura fumiferana]